MPTALYSSLVLKYTVSEVGYEEKTEGNEQPFIFNGDDSIKALGQNRGNLYTTNDVKNMSDRKSLEENISKVLISLHFKRTN